MPTLTFGTGGPVTGLAYTFWYGLTSEGNTGYFPAVAYHPSLHRRIVEYEAKHLLSKYGRTRGREGTPLPPGVPPSSSYSNMKLWGHASRLGLHLSVCMAHPVDPAIIGHEVASQFVTSEHDYFLQFVNEVEKNRGLLVTLLDDDLTPRFDMLQLLVEHYEFQTDRVRG